MATHVSAYEQLRLDNIARNDEVLRSLGLLEEKKPPPPAPPKKRSRDDDDDVDTFKLQPEASRRSDRVSRKPALFAGLTDEYFKTEEKEDGDDKCSRVSTRPQRAQSSPRLTYEDEYQNDVPPRRRTTMKLDERRMTVHMPNLSVGAASSPTDIPNATLMQPRPRATPMGGDMGGGMGMGGGVGGTSRSSAHPCPICKRNTLVRARDRATGFYFLVKHSCNGVERDMVRVG